MKSRILPALLTIILGALFAILQSKVISITMTVFGIVLLVYAIQDFVRKETAPGVIKAVAGVCVIVFGWVLLSAALYIMSAVLLIYGILQLIESIRVKPVTAGKAGKVLHYVEPVLTILCAAALLFNQNGAVSWIFIAVGVVLIIDGILTLINSRHYKDAA